jgi:hypothetical protein
MLQPKRDVCSILLGAALVIGIICSSFLTGRAMRFEQISPLRSPPASLPKPIPGQFLRERGLRRRVTACGGVESALRIRRWRNNPFFGLLLARIGVVVKDPAKKMGGCSLSHFNSPYPLLHEKISVLAGCANAGPSACGLRTRHS